MSVIVKYMIFISVMTTSFDVFLAWQIGGTVRFCQMIMVFPCIFFVLKIIKYKTIVVPYAIKWLLIWSICLLLFVLNTTHIERTIGYWLWLIFSIIGMFVVTNVFDSKNKLKQLLRVYLFSFVFVSLFGLLQFFGAPIFSFSTPLVTQWWIPGTLARINGFSYEPSYFATYEIIGWSIFFVLLHSDQVNNIFTYRTNKIFFLIITISILLSSSRIGIITVCLVVVLDCIYRSIFFIKMIFKGKLLIKSMKKICLWSLIVLFIGLISSEYIDFNSYDFLLSGTGINGAASHSVDDRSEAARDTFNVFLENPILGVSLGGIPEKIGYLKGIEANDKVMEGSTVGLEVLAASGIFGIIPFLIYFILVLKKARVIFYKRYYIGIGLIISLIVEIFILQFNQNILRPYFWMHLAVLSAYYNVERVDLIYE